MAAHRHGILEAIMPRENEKDLPDIPEAIKQDHEAEFRRFHGRGSEDRAGARDSWRCRCRPGCRDPVPGGEKRAHRSCGSPVHRAAERYERRAPSERTVAYGSGICSQLGQRRSSFPPTGLPEIAFLGRSNVGKSSLINALVGQERAGLHQQHAGPHANDQFLPGRRSVLLRRSARIWIRPGARADRRRMEELIEQYLGGAGDPEAFLPDARYPPRMDGQGSGPEAVARGSWQTVPGSRHEDRQVESI